MFTSYFVGMALAIGQVQSQPQAYAPPPVPSQALINRLAADPPGTHTPTPPAKTDTPPEKNGNSDANGKEEKPPEPTEAGFFRAFFKAYKDEFCPKEKKADDTAAEKPKRTANPAPFRSPSFPSAEWQGYPNVGVPPVDYGKYPLMKGLYATPYGEDLKQSRVFVYGWITGSANYSTSKDSNVPASYAIVPNRAELEQAVLRFEREPDMVQTDHVDWGFRVTNIYGIDYRYTTAGGNFSEQLLKHNRLYGWDPLEYYGDLYIPGIADGLNLRLGRYISPPDIEAQLAPDNFLASHSILFTYDNYTQTGLLATLKLSNQWMVQAGINAGGDMAPWYKGAIATGFLGARWISCDNKDSIYTCMNDINNAKYRNFSDDGVPTGHDNYNYIVSTWTHRFSDTFMTATEGYYMWQRDAVVGGTPTVGPPQPFFPSVGQGPVLPGVSTAYGLLNYTAFQLSKRDYVTIRNEWWDDPQGMRSGFASNYSSHTVGLAHNFNSVLQIRPEIGYYRSYNTPAFDNGTRFNQLMFECDVTLRF